MRPKQLDPSANNSDTPSLQLEQRISFDTALVMLRLLSISIPVFTMGLTWPWIGPVVPATLVPYLVGILVQFKYEQIARYWKSPSWAAIPFIFHVRPILIPSLLISLNFSCLIKLVSLNLLIVGFFEFVKF